MIYKHMEGIELPVSRIVFGTANPPMIAGEDATELLDSVFEGGVNCFDTARRYGMAERSLGDWIAKRGNRDKIVIVDKGAHPLPDSTVPRVTPAAIEADIARSLDLLQTDHVDVYMLHRDDTTQPVGPIMEVLNELRERGKIRLLGVSNWTTGRIEAANEYAYEHDLEPFTVSSPNYGLAEQVLDPWGGGCVSISGPDEAGTRRWYQDSGMELFAYATLAHGLFSGKIRSDQLSHVADYLDEFAIRGYCCRNNYERLRRTEQIAEKHHCTVAQAALAWVLAQPLQVFAEVSASTPQRFASNLKALELQLNETELRYMDLL
ncbi:MAG: aldo/keto reductase [bacterium]|nr:aldo/keto reductase [bacterium]MDY4099780.1 aldo/keto reductase [Lachnospiraceae bacterium]